MGVEIFRNALRMLEEARAGLAEAACSSSPTERYAGAHLAALRATAAILATRARPAPSRRRPTSAWALLMGVAPEFGEWAGYFAAGARKRAAAEAGLQSAVTSREADDLVRDVSTFLALAETTVGVLPSTPGRDDALRSVVHRPDALLTGAGSARRAG